MSRNIFGTLKIFRIVCGIAVLFVITWLFIGRDFGWLPQPVRWPADFQAGPAILHILTRPVVLIAVTAAVFLLLLTWLLGRVYCSFLCPLGIFQDVLGRLFRWLHLRRNNYRPLPSWRPWRLAVLAVSAAGLAAGIILPLVLLDPYAVFGRMISTTASPILVALNNLAVRTIGEGRFAWLQPVDPNPTVPSILVASLIMLLILAFAVWRWGRIYCNTLCPIGALLSQISRISLFKLQFSAESCHHCQACVKTCKSGCIDAKTKAIDFERCVMCLNCGASCNFNGLNLVRRTWKTPMESSPQTSPPDDSRRSFIAAAGTTVVGAALLPTAWLSSRKTAGEKSFPIMPPGAGSFDHLASRCIGCHLCITSCPTKVIKPSTLEYGLSGFMMPTLDFHRNMCEFDCTTCSRVCPTGALTPLSRPEKHLTQIGKVKYVKERCVVYCNETDCGACAEHCPTQAVTMKPWKDGLNIPVTDPSICVGCGACEHICPVKPERAIFVTGSPTQGRALPPPKLKNQPAQTGSDGFPF